MNNITTMIEQYKPETFISYQVSIFILMSKFKLTWSEAFVLRVLLREYKANNANFGVKSGRHHIAKIRKKLCEPIDVLSGYPFVISLGMGFYMISDPVKQLIKEHVEK